MEQKAWAARKLRAGGRAMLGTLLSLPPLPTASWCAHGPFLQPTGLCQAQCRCSLLVARLQWHSACLVSHSRIPEGWWNCPPAGKPSCPWATCLLAPVSCGAGHWWSEWPPLRRDCGPGQMAEQIPQTSLVQLAGMSLQLHFSDCVGIKCSL